MIVSFSIANFRSFSSEETLTLVASNRLSGSLEDHAVPIPDSNEKVLRTAVLYGANGAGKSNLFKALRFLRWTAMTARKKNSGTGRVRFRFSGEPEEPSVFDLQFIVADKLYRYGFKADDERITEEWLFQLIGGRQKLIYERTTDENGKVALDAGGLKGEGDKVEALATVGGPQNQSFLATVNVTLDAGDYGEVLGRVLSWFKENLTLVGPDESFGGLGQALDRSPDFRSFAGEFLKSAGTGVDHLEVLKKTISVDELRNLLPDSTVSEILREMPDGEDGDAFLSLEDGNELRVESSADKTFSQISVRAAHEHEPGNVVQLELAEESDGTRRLLNLIPALYHMRKTGAVYFIDEIDRSLHPILVKEFLEFFLKLCRSGCRQIIVTTHESNLLDQDLLRRDEIWFAEKDLSAATRLYSLLDFKVRNDLEIRKHYLQGRFGAVPFLGNLEQLGAKAAEAE